GGIVSLGQDTALTSAGRGLFARDDGSRITTVGATVKAAREFGALASEKGVIELTQGEVTGHDAGLRALGGGKIQATGTQ
ncbi:hypothetical protein SB773_34130, partial [Bacillus sp. SIMBA_074]|uniref:hypothetical protein n=1 Tax=Bacillus sp. SIMBA_074 TaxID=3085812 RepID=UPI003979AACF